MDNFACMDFLWYGRNNCWWSIGFGVAFYRTVTSWNYPEKEALRKHWEKEKMLGLDSPTIHKNVLRHVLQIFQYLAIFECYANQKLCYIQIDKSWRKRQRMLLGMVGEYGAWLCNQRFLLFPQCFLLHRREESLYELLWVCHLQVILFWCSPQFFFS